MNYIGFDKVNEKLQIGDICTFKIGDIEYEGMIMYDEDVFSFVFEMDCDNFPCVCMSKANLNTINKICSVGSTRRGDRFEFFRENYGKAL